MKRNESAFTLIELLIVIAIIAVLASLVLNTAGFIQKKGARSRTEAEISALTTALESYKVENGEYPPGTNSSLTPTGNNKFLFTSLSPSSGKVYYEFGKSMTNSQGYVVDPFGNSYGYQYPGDTNRNGASFFDLWSSGGTTGMSKSNQWIKNW